jgi:hypothetical protein
MCCRRGFIDYAQGIDSRAIPREKEHVNQSIEELKDMNLEEFTTSRIKKLITLYTQMNSLFKQNNIIF